ncbi:hypothetical protein D3C85_1664760 [compost metagenome]
MMGLLTQKNQKPGRVRVARPSWRMAYQVDDSRVKVLVRIKYPIEKTNRMSPTSAGIEFRQLMALRMAS